MSSLILFGSFVGFLLVKVPVGIALGFASICAMFYTGTLSPSYLAQGLVTALDSFPLLAIPFFILSGNIMGKGGISNRLLDCAGIFFGRMYGGLGIVTVVACMFFAAISGSGPATVAAIGGITIPAMIAQGYDKKFAGALSAAAGSIGVIIPPSIPMVMYGVSTGASVTGLFMAGVVPGFLIGIGLMIYCYVVSKKKGWKAPVIKEEQKVSGFKTFWDAKWALLCPVIILGGIYGGIFTPTEAAAVSVAYGLIVSMFVYKELSVKDIAEILSGSALQTGTIMIIIGTATTFGRILTLEQIPNQFANFLTTTLSSKVLILLAINILLLFVGCFMDTTAAIIILAPILLPVITALGVNVVHFGIIMVVNLSIGFVTPPLGVNLFVACNVAKAKLEEIAAGILPIIGVMVAILMAITYIEPISMFLVNLLTK